MSYVGKYSTYVSLCMRACVRACVCTFNIRVRFYPRMTLTLTLDLTLYTGNRSRYKTHKNGDRFPCDIPRRTNDFRKIRLSLIHAMIADQALGAFVAQHVTGNGVTRSGSGGSQTESSVSRLRHDGKGGGNGTDDNRRNLARRDTKMAARKIEREREREREEERERGGGRGKGGAN